MAKIKAKWRRKPLPLDLWSTERTVLLELSGPADRYASSLEQRGWKRNSAFRCWERRVRLDDIGRAKQEVASLSRRLLVIERYGE